MLDGTAGVLVAVSGGADSVVLLDLLSTLRSPNPRVHVAHLDHMLRGRESRRTPSSSAGWRIRWLGIHNRSIDVGAGRQSFAAEGSKRMARELDYGFLLEAAAEAGCDRVAVGHTSRPGGNPLDAARIVGGLARDYSLCARVSTVPRFLQGEGGRREGRSGTTVDRRRKCRRAEGRDGRQNAEGRRQKAKTVGQEAEGKGRRPTARFQRFPLFARYPRKYRIHSRDDEYLLPPSAFTF